MNADIDWVSFEKVFREKLIVTTIGKYCIPFKIEMKSVESIQKKKKKTYAI